MRFGGMSLLYLTERYDEFAAQALQVVIRRGTPWHARSIAQHRFHAAIRRHL